MRFRVVAFGVLVAGVSFAGPSTAAPAASPLNDARARSDAEAPNATAPAYAPPARPATESASPDPAAHGPMASVQDLDTGRESASVSRSIGWPWRGRLLSGKRLEPSVHTHLLEADRERDFYFGTEELVGMVLRAAERIAREAPGARLQVGELSKRGGGNVVGHRSHENGRDVDLGFFLVDEQGAPVEANHFLAVKRSGSGWVDERRIRFDTRRNWLLVRALLEDPEAHVQHIFVARALRARLLREAERLREPRALLEKAERVLMPPLGSSHPHLNHYHVRIFCPARDVPACRDRRPYYPWLPATHPFAALVTAQPDAANQGAFGE